MKPIAPKAARVLRVVRDLHSLSDVYDGTYGQCCHRYHEDVQAVAEALIERSEKLEGLLNDLRNIRGAEQSDEFDLRRCCEQVEEMLNTSRDIEASRPAGELAASLTSGCKSLTRHC